MQIIGITGTSGSGKTTVSQILGKRSDCQVIDADKMAKEQARRDSEYLAAIQQAFVEENVFAGDGRLNRKKLAAIIYKDREKLQKLNALTFQILVPQIVAEIHAVPAGTNYVVIDAPLLLEAKIDAYCDYVIVLEAPESVKIKRICQRDGICKEAAQSRLHIQGTDAFYEEKADYVLQNDENTTLEALEKQVNAIIKREETT